jgi:flagellin-like hook-associated protein FlgL
MNISNSSALVESAGQSQDLLNSALTRLSSGTTFIDGGDNPASQATASAYTSTNGLVQAALANVQTTLSYTQTADGDMSAMQSILSRMSQLATLAGAPLRIRADRPTTRPSSRRFRTSCVRSSAARPRRSGARPT